MTWVYRSIYGLCLASYWAFYGHSISWRLPVTGFLVFTLGLIAPEIGTILFIVSYPILLYLNQYPALGFSSSTFFVIALSLGLSFRRPARLGTPLAVVCFYFCISVVRYRQDWASTLQGVWTTDQMSPTLFAGICVMWAAGIMFFDFLREMKPRWLYYALIAQGTLFASMAAGNIWLRSKQVLQYQFLFGDVNAFAAYLILQIGLVAGLWKRRRSVAGWTGIIALLSIDSLLLVASWSRAGLAAYFAMIFLCVSVLVASWIYQRSWQRLVILATVFLLMTGFVAAHGVSWSVTELDNLYRTFEPMAPNVLKHGFISRVDELHTQFSTRVRLMTPEVLYRQRIRDWDVPLTVIGDYPLFGIGVGAFYRNSLAYAKRAPQDYLIFYFHENAHNYYLQIAAETGLVGLILFLGFLAWLLSKHLILTDPVKLGCGLALAGLMIVSLAQHPLLVDRVFFVFVMICAVIAGSEKKDDIESKDKSESLDRISIPALSS